MRRKYGRRRSLYGRARRATRRLGRGYSRRRRVSNRTPRPGRIGYRL